MIRGMPGEDGHSKTNEGDVEQKAMVQKVKGKEWLVLTRQTE